MDSLTELYNEIRIADSEEVFTPRQRKRENITIHHTVIGRLVFNVYGKRATPLMYIAANNLSSKMLQEGFLWWAIEEKIRRILDWGKSKNAFPGAVVKVFNREIKK